MEMGSLGGEEMKFEDKTKEGVYYIYVAMVKGWPR